MAVYPNTPQKALAEQQSRDMLELQRARNSLRDDHAYWQIGQQSAALEELRMMLEDKRRRTSYGPGSYTAALQALY